jgi:hypothetical protein
LEAGNNDYLSLLGLAVLVLGQAGITMDDAEEAGSRE